MASIGSQHRDPVDLLLAAGWGVAIVVAVATYLAAGFVGWLALFTWSAVAGPLGVLSARRLAVRQHPLDGRCRGLALRWWVVLALATITVAFAPAVQAQREIPWLAGAVLLLGMWLVFVGQWLYIVSATRWMLGQLLAPKQARTE